MAAVSYTCPRCGRTSHNPNDVRERYCGACHTFEGDEVSLFEEMLMATGVPRHQAHVLLLLAEAESERIKHERESDDLD
jgi:hypothetical protein